MNMRSISFVLALSAMPQIGWADAQDDRVQAMFQMLYGETCTSAAEAEGAAFQRFELQSPATDGETAPVTLWEYTCTMAAYNVSYVYFMASEYRGLQPVSFASPRFYVRYSDPEDIESPVEAIEIQGWQTSPFIINGGFDQTSQQIEEYAKWRGLGDASNSGTWALSGEGFTLLSYEVDASYDEEMSPEVIFAVK